MKKYKYLSLFAAAFLGIASFTSCTNDDTEDAKANYNISFVSSSLGSDAEAAFKARAAAMLFSGETDNTRWIDYGLYCSQDYAQNSYNAVKNDKYDFIQDSLVNVIADLYNLAPGSFDITMVLKDASGNVIDNSAVWQPTVERQDLTITLTAQTADGEDLEDYYGDPRAKAAGASANMYYYNLLSLINDSIAKVYGSAEYIDGKTENITSGYAKGYYAGQLANELQAALTNISLENDNESDFRVCLSIVGGEEDIDVDIYPIATYTVAYEIVQGSLTDAQLAAMKTAINTNVMNAAAISSYTEEGTYADVNKKFEDLLRKANTVLQNDIVNGTAQQYEINDFYVEMQLLASDGTIINYKTYEPAIGMDLYTIEVEVTGLSDETLKNSLVSALGDGKNVGLHTLAKAMNIFTTNVEAVKAADIIKNYAAENKNINFDVDFVLYNSKGVSVDVISYSGKDGWTYPTE